jgi:hypothetical protein
MRGVKYVRTGDQRPARSAGAQLSARQRPLLTLALGFHTWRPLKEDAALKQLGAVVAIRKRSNARAKATGARFTPRRAMPLL